MPIKRRGDGTAQGKKTLRLSRREDKSVSTQKSGPYSINKPRALDGELGEVVKLWNGEAPGTFRKATDLASYGRLASNILSLDLCLAGGWLRSRVGMLYGERSTGKSTLQARAAASAQRRDPDGFAVILDIEGTLDKQWMALQGVDLDRLIVVEPDTGEHAVDQADGILRSLNTCFLGIDSIAMITPFKEIDASAEDQQIGVQPRLIAKMLRKLNNALLQERKREHHPTVLLNNQFRMKAGLVFGDPRTLPGGKALEFATSQQVETRNKENKNKDNVVTFNQHTIVVSKDKTGGRIKEGTFKLIRDESEGAPVGYIDQAASILEFGEKAGLVRGRYEIDGFRLKFRGKDDLRRYLIDHPAEEALIVHKIIEHYRRKWKIDI